MDAVTHGVSSAAYLWWRCFCALSLEVYEVLYEVLSLGHVHAFSNSQDEQADAGRDG